MSLWRLASHEIRLLMRERTLPVALLLITGATCLGIQQGIESARAQERQVETLQLADERWRSRAITLVESWERQPGGPPPSATHPSVAGGAAVSASLPAAPLATLAIGQTDLYPHAVRVAMWVRRAEQFVVSELQSPVRLLAGRFDVAFVALYLYPLLLLALSFRMLSGDREAGILPLVLTYPVPLHRIVAAKILSCSVLAAALPVLLVLAGAMVPELRANFDRLLAWSGVVFVYGLFWVLLAAAVNLVASSSVVNATMLASVWVLLVVVLPSLLAATVHTVHPVPSRMALLLQLRTANHQAVRDREALLMTHYRDHPELMPNGPDADRLNKSFVVEQRAVNHQLAPLIDAFEAALEGQQRLIDRYSMLSPAASAQELLNDLAGTGNARFAAFRRQVGTFQEGWTSRHGEMVFGGKRLSSIDLSHRPAFTFREEPTADVLKRSTRSAAILIVFAGVPGIVAWVWARRPQAGVRWS